jgi:glycosyltransferase involved in cell wall biosynthesis
VTATDPNPLRVAFLAGTLDQGGAEKQLTYMARALKEAGVDVRVYSLRRGEYCEAVLQKSGLAATWIGRYDAPPVRLANFAKELSSFRPHVVQAAHFFTNLYVAFAGRLFSSIVIGSLRGDTTFEMEQNGRWGPWLLRLPPSLLANSRLACRNAKALGVPADALHLVPNVIDLREFDASARNGASRNDADRISVMAIGRLVRVKRYDLFLRAIAAARQQVPSICGVLVGDGPERAPLEHLAAELNLKSEHLTFLGRRSDVPQLLRSAEMLVLCSTHEGFPNVILEAMAAGVPTVTTPVGDVAEIVENGRSGIVVPANDLEALTNCIVHLARAEDERRKMGRAARVDVEKRFSFDRLGVQLLATYSAVAEQQRRQRVLPVVVKQLQRTSATL